MRRAVGIFFFLGLALLGLLSLWVDDEGVFGRGGSYYHVVLKSAEGLQEGNSVWLGGMQAGRIVKVAMDEQGRHIHVHFVLRPRARLREDSEVTLQTASLLANSRNLSLTLGSSPNFLPESLELPGTEVKNVRPVTGLDTLVEKADGLFASLKEAGPAIKEAAQSVRNIAKKIEDGQGTVGKLINDPKLYNDLVGAVAKLDEGLASFRNISGKLEKGEGTLGKLLNDPKMYEELTGAVGKLNSGLDSFKAIAAKIEKGEGTIGKLVNDEALYKDLSEASKGIAELARKVNSGQGTLGKLVADPALYDELKGAASSLASVMRKIDEGEGTLGRLVTDDSLYREATRFMREAREAVEDAREQAPITAFGSVIFAAFQ